MTPIEALNRVRKIGLAFGVTDSFIAAHKLGIFDRLADGPKTADELGRALGVNPEGLRRLLVVLHHLELLERTGDRFGNSELGDYLTAQSPVPLNGLAALDPFPHMWEFLPEAIRTYAPVWKQALGATRQDIWDSLYKDPAELRNFAHYMNSYSVAIGQEIAERYDFRPHTCILDVAGGSGQLSQQIALRHEHLCGIVMDLPNVLDVAKEVIAANGLADRFSTQTADLFGGPYPRGADVATLSWILHDWNDDQCRTILRHCYEALPPGGTLLISECVMNEDHSGTLENELYSIFMLVVCDPGGRERSFSEHRGLLRSAGFGEVDHLRLEGPRDLIVARRT